MRHITPAFRTFSGDDALEAMPGELERAGVSRVVLICGASTMRHPRLVAAVENALGARLARRWIGVQANSPLPSVLDAREVIREARADAVVALGGGSAVVTARAATILAAEGTDVRQLCTRRDSLGRLISPRLVAPKLPQWIVPTTPTTSMATAGAAVHHPRTTERLALFDPKARAVGVFIDPIALSTAPAALVRSAALNAFSMAVEGMQAVTDDPIAEALLRQSLRMTARWLPAPGEGEISAGSRVDLALAALLCGEALGHLGGGGIAQALSHAAGPYSQTSNAVIEAILLPHTMRYNSPETAGRLSGFVDLIRGAHEPPTDSDTDAVVRVLNDARVPSRLRDVGVSRESLDAIADRASEDWSLEKAVRRADRETLMTLLSAAW